MSGKRLMIELLWQSRRSS